MLTQNRLKPYWQQTVQNRMLLVVLAMVVLIPLLASPADAAMQLFAHRASSLMAALLAGILVLRARVATRRADVLTFFATGPNAAILLYGLFTLLTLLMGPSSALVALGPSEAALRRVGWMEAQRLLTGILLYFALAYHVRRSEHLVKIRDALVLVSGVMALLALLTLGLQAAKQGTALFGDPQLIGAFLMILLPVPLVAAVTEREDRRRGPLLATLLTGLGLLFSSAPTAWAGGLTATLALFGLNRLGGKSNDAPNPFRLPAILALAGFLSALTLWLAFSGIREQRAENKVGSPIYRQRMLAAATRLVRLEPIRGTGLGTYPIVQQRFSGNGRLWNAVIRSRASLAEMAHNLWWQTAAEQGLLGAALLAAIPISFLITGARRLRFLEGGIRRALLLSGLGAVAGFVVDAFGNPAWQFGQVGMFFWLMLGLGVACMRPRHG